MRALLVHARSPVTYWSYEYALPYAAKRAALAPLGLATVAALLPSSWELRLVDLQVEPLHEEDLAWADAVLVSGMLVQASSMRTVLARARALGKRTVVGGPAATATPEAFPEADHVFQGEAEGRLGRLVEALEAPGAPAPRVLSPDGGGRPGLEGAPVPRFDLLRLELYASLSVQVSRGCPFRCEFCDIIEMYGRVPRLKSADQVVAELEALHRLGGRGPLFFVDDNFIGNRRAVARLLPRIAEWQREHGRPFDLYTEASLDLAAHPDLVAAMREAGFSAVFVGLESPSAESLQATGKTQNLRVDPVEAVDRLTRTGFEVFAGFIVGFDTDGPDIFDRQLELISRLPVPRAMVGLLGAAPGTALWRRLESEGRLRRDSTGDQFGRPNFDPTMDERTLVAGYRRLLAALYDANAFYERAGLVVDRVGDVPTPMRRGTIRALVRAVWGIGVRGRRRRHFWRLAARAARRGPSVLARGLSLAALGEHMIRYTEEVVLPRLDETLAEIDAGAARGALPGSRAAAG
jgi:radical SAM superfamily enzyme YgiQ (UPF0313 family)